VQNTAFSTNKTLNINGRLIDLSETRIMGILNVTPDSFYDGGRHATQDNILQHAERMLREGATFIDIGGYSSRPGATNISVTEETDRVIPAIRIVRKNFPEFVISIDTFRSEVARIAVSEGAALINDISGGSLDGQMYETVAMLKIPYILMHMKGDPQTMTRQAEYAYLVKEINQYFSQRIHALNELGVHDIILDPGFGFAKTRAHNFELLNNLELLHIHGRPVLAGLSRKSMIWKTLEIDPDDALNGTTALNTIALLKGVNILRVHDVREAAQVVKLVGALPG
jgi:dihydropteroate synthase